MKVSIDPACNANYSSFYIKGLWDLYGKSNVRFRSAPFDDLRYGVNTHCFAFCIDGKKYAIDYADSNEIFYESFLAWADIYGKVNYKPELLPKYQTSKIVHVSPNFGIGCFGRNKWQATLNCLKSYKIAYNRLDMTFMSFLSPYLWLYKRAGVLKNKASSVVGSKTIFMVSRFWNGEDDANKYRINFIRACRTLQNEGRIEFIGGMIPNTNESDCPEDVLLNKEIPMTKYMELMTKSLLVFNTPAVHNCHGWKLPEYLSQGKIILSTPLINELPIALEHGKNIFFTGTSEDAIYNSIKELLNNTDLQRSLEQGSMDYWIQNASPKACISHFLNN